MPVAPPRAVTALLGGALLVAACREPTPGRADSAATAPVAADTNPTPWYAATRTLDLTGDGVADTARLEALGVRVDSLDITLSLIVGGAAAHREEWGSSYELALADSASRTGPAAEPLLRDALDAVLASIEVRPLPPAGGETMAEDSATLAVLEPRPAHLVAFAYGYETTVRLAWDATRTRFVRLWSCC